MPNRNQELLGRLLTALDLEFVDATEGMEDGWYVWRLNKDWPVDDYQLFELADGEILDTATQDLTIDCCKPYGQLAGPILGR